jgi:3-hydroxyisobutyrate dehydrogenase
LNLLLTFPVLDIVVTLDSSERVENFFRSSLNAEDVQGKVFLVLDTIPKDLSHSLHDYVSANGGSYLECPTIGGKNHAETLRLQVIFAGTEAQFKDVRPLLCCFGTPKFVGPVGSALAIKFAHKSLAVMNLLGFASASAILRGLGADPAVFLEAIKMSPFYVPTFTAWNEKMAKEIFDKDVTWTPFQLSKELNVIVAEAKSIGVDTRLLEAARDIIDETASSEHKYEDFTSVVTVVAANVKAPKTRTDATGKQA